MPSRTVSIAKKSECRLLIEMCALKICLVSSPNAEETMVCKDNIRIHRFPATNGNEPEPLGSSTSTLIKSMNSISCISYTVLVLFH